MGGTGWQPCWLVWWASAVGVAHAPVRWGVGGSLREATAHPHTHTHKPALPSCCRAQVAQLRLICGDVLRQDLPALLAGMQRHPEQLDCGAAEAAEAAAGQELQAQQRAQPGGQPAAEQQQVEGAAVPVEQQQDHLQPAAPAARQEESAPAEQRKVKVVANLPYYITKDLLVQMLPLGDRVSALYLMLQARAHRWVSFRGFVELIEAQRRG